MQAKDVPEAPILRFMATVDPHPFVGFQWYRTDSPVSLYRLPELADVPEPVLLAKMRKLIKRGLVSGCGCGCRGDFHITDKGMAAIKEVGG